MSIRTMRVSLVLAFTCLIVPALAHAGWSADPVQVHASSAHIPQVSAADDGHSGAIVVWQEDSATGGALRALHLLATGDMDPAWPLPVFVSSGDVKRDALGAIPDGVGGAYVWWIEGRSIYMSRMAPEGVIAAGWPTRGRLLGTLMTATSRPVVQADGSGGIYIGWIAQVGGIPLTTALRAFHLGPTNSGKGGWPSGGRTISTGQAGPSITNTFGIGVRSDGGLWTVTGCTVLSDSQTFEPGDLRVRKLTSSGATVPGWPSGGVIVAPFHGERLVESTRWGITPAMRLSAIADDGEGGAIVLFGSPTGAPGSIYPEYMLQRLAADGNVAPGWATEPVPPAGYYALAAYSGELEETSLRVEPDPRGGVFVGIPMFYDHSIGFSLERMSSSGVLLGERAGGGIHRPELVPRRGGGYAGASCVTSGPYGPNQPYASISASLGSGMPGYFEWHTENVLTWYGDVGLSATADGGAIFIWSQERERFGLFAIRLNPAGQVTEVLPETFQPRLRAHFARGRGVLAQVTLPGALDAELALLDVQGRVESTVRAASNSTLETTFPGTAALSPGVYFVRASGAGQQLTRRVVVLR